MNERPDADRLTEIIKKGTPEDCISYLAPHSRSERRGVAETAVKLFKEWDRLQYETMLRAKRRTSVEPDVARVAVLATANLSQVKSCGWNICPPSDLMVRVFTQFQPDWLDAWVGHLLDKSPFGLRRVRVLWEEGLCSKPDSESYVLAVIVSPQHTLWPDPDTDLNPESWKNRDTLANRLRRRPDLIPDLWKFFEIEGNGRFSLAAYDNSNPADDNWATALRELSELGLMDRDRLLDASLDALARDFAQFRASWHSRFFQAMAPTESELIVRKERFLQLLGSAIPPTVSFALRAIKQIDKADSIQESGLVDALQPVLQARQKSTVTTGLRLIETATKRAPTVRERALPVVLNALIHESADVQAKALNLLEELGIDDHPQILTRLGDYLDGLAPSIRPRASALCGAEAVAPTKIASVAKAEPNPIDAIDSFDAFVAEFLHVLEDTSKPIRIEGVVDGLARYGASMPPDFEQVIGPLVKRAGQILASASDTTTRYGLAHLAHLYGHQLRPELPERMTFGSMISLGWSHRKTSLDKTSFITIFLKWNLEILRQVQKGLNLPMLCAPTDDRGFVAAKTLVERVKFYESSNASPSAYDLSMAMMRLDVVGRKEALSILEPRSEITRALSFALGGEMNIRRLNVGKTKWLWVAAAAARQPRIDTPRIAELSGVTAPDVGLEALYEVSVSMRQSGPYVFPEVGTKTTPQIRGTLPDTFLPGLFHLTTAGNFSGSICGHSADDIRWASLVWPQNFEPFFSQGSTVFAPDQKLSNSPYAAFIEPMLSPHVRLGPIGHLLLSQSVASTDAAVSSLAVEVLIVGIEEHRIDVDRLADATRDLITKASLPTARWTRVFGAVAKVSYEHAVFLRRLITRIVQFDPMDPPRNAGGMVELLYELHVETGTTLTDEDTLRCVRGISAGGKLGKFSKRLLSL